jgi:hypothetical protein
MFRNQVKINLVPVEALNLGFTQSCESAKYQNRCKRAQTGDPPTNSTSYNAEAQLSGPARS